MRKAFQFSFTFLGLFALSVTGCAASPDLEEDIETSDSALSAFTCREVSKKNAANAPYGQLVATRAAGHPGFDRFVMEFRRDSGVPNYTIRRQSSSTFYMDGSGDELRLTGRAGIGVTAEMASGWDFETGEPSFSGSRQYKPTSTNVLKEAAFTGDFEGQVNWGLGLSRGSCYRVFELSNPPRLVLDIKTS